MHELSVAMAVSSGAQGLEAALSGHGEIEVVT